VKRHGASRLLRRLWPHRGRLLIVVDDAGWILDEVGRGLASHLPRELQTRLVTHDWRYATGCTIHFLSRPWAWSDGVLDSVHPSNRLLGLWWHGRVDSPEPAFREALDRLRRLHDRFDRIQVTCSSGRETVLAVGVPPEKIVQLPEGVDITRFRPAADEEQRIQARRQLGISQDATAIGCFQKDGDGWGEGLTPKLVKGPDVLADALEDLKPRCKLQVVIPGPARGYLKKRLSRSGVPFVAPGFVDRDVLPSLYHALDMYVSPSRDEGGPAGVLEAMASGVPVVSTRTGMAADLIESGRNGLLVGIGNAPALANAMLQMAEDGTGRRAMALRAHAMIAAYDWSRVAARYAEELYA
jgi:glycosyltransferase involved in cell wall biosynthesis